MRSYLCKHCQNEITIYVYLCEFNTKLNKISDIVGQ